MDCHPRPGQLCLRASPGRKAANRVRGDRRAAAELPLSGIRRLGRLRFGGRPLQIDLERVYVQPLYLKLLDLQPPDDRAADRQTPDRQGAYGGTPERRSTDSQRAKRDRPGLSRAMQSGRAMG